MKYSFNVELDLARPHPENEVADFIVSALRSQAQRYAVSSAFYNGNVSVSGNATSYQGKMIDGSEVTVDQAKMEAAAEPISYDEKAEDERQRQADEQEKLEAIEEAEEAQRELLKEIAPEGSNQPEIGGTPVDDKGQDTGGEHDRQPETPEGDVGTNDGNKSPSTAHKDQVDGTNNPTDGTVTDTPATAPTPASNPGQEPITPFDDILDGEADGKSTPQPSQQTGGGKSPSAKPFGKGK